MNETEDETVRRKRLLFRCTHRGIRELDLILGEFARASLSRMGGRQLDDLESLLDAADDDLYQWISGRAMPPPAMDTPVIELIINFKINMVNNC